MPCGCAAVDRAKAVAQGVRSPTTHGHERRGGAGGTRQARANEPKGLSKGLFEKVPSFGTRYFTSGCSSSSSISISNSTSTDERQRRGSGRSEARGPRRRQWRRRGGDDGGDDGEERGDNAAMAGGGDAGDDGGNGVATAGVSLTSRAQGAR